MFKIDFEVYVDKLVLFCKSYHKDMYRARRLAQSVAMHNQDGIPFYMSVPASDFEAFAECLKPYPCHLITDEEILNWTREANGEIPSLFPSHLMQQLIKLEFWREGLCNNYVWLDSDSYFLKKFKISDFMFDDETPYTVQHKAEELLSFAQKMNDVKITTDLMQMTAKMQGAFGRVGEWYDFGGPPLIWSSGLLQSLYEDYLLPNKKSIYSLLVEYPCEMQLYGEYLLSSNKMPLIPIEPLFKIYHYAEQFFAEQVLGVSEHELSKDYLGVILQSNWARLPEAKRPTKERLKRVFRKAFRQVRDLMHLTR